MYVFETAYQKRILDIWYISFRISGYYQDIISFSGQGYRIGYHIQKKRILNKSGRYIRYNKKTESNYVLIVIWPRYTPWRKSDRHVDSRRIRPGDEQRRWSHTRRRRRYPARNWAWWACQVELFLPVRDDERQTTNTAAVLSGPLVTRTQWSDPRWTGYSSSCSRFQGEIQTAK